MAGKRLIPFLACVAFALTLAPDALAQALQSAQPRGFAMPEEPPMSALQVQRDAFESAMSKNDIAKVAEFIRGGIVLDFNFNFERRGRTSDSPLTGAVKRGRIEIVRMLLDAGADIRRKDGWGDCAINAARTPEMVKFLVSRGADPNVEGMYGQTAAAKALESGNLELVDALVAAGARLDAGKSTDLFNRVVELKKPELIPELLKRGVSPQLPPTRALQTLIEKGDIANFKLLLANGADPNAGDGYQRPILLAIFRKQWEIAEALLDAGASLKITDRPGCEKGMACESIQAVRYATFNPEFLVRLKARGADLDTVSSGGHTALTSLIVDVPMALVVNQGTAIGVAVSPDGRQVSRQVQPSAPPTFIPAPDNVARLKALLDAGANPNVKFKPFTPLMLAASLHGKPPAMIDALLAAGGRIEFDATVLPLKQDDGSFGQVIEIPAEGHGVMLLGAEPSGGFDRMLNTGNYQGILTGMRIGPLGWAVHAGHPEIALRLVERDRRIDAADKNLLYFAAAADAWDLMLAATRYTKEVNVANRADVTPLILAAYAGRADVVRALLAAGAQVNTRSDRAWPPLLQRNPANEFLGALGGHGPRPPKLVGGYTALRAAKERGHADVARILSEAGGRD